ncbi:MAG: LCP family protein, partial [Anaerolineales bacterium]|nr:LCP family protein [Anaerolineales bacterium]
MYPPPRPQARLPRPAQPPHTPWTEERPVYRGSSRRRRRPPRSILPTLRWRAPRIGAGCLALGSILAALGLALAVYLFLPVRANILLLGIDYTEPGSRVGRSDAIMLATIVPLEPYVGLLSIPRDLWVLIPGVGENRINTAHYYAESSRRGSGPALAMQTVAVNFGVGVPYYVRIRFQGFRNVVDALGGVDIELSEPRAGYPAGKHHLTGRKALAFVRHRLSSDDFHRMGNGQFMLRALFKEMLHPFNWPRIPAAMKEFFKAIDTNIPAWMWPRLAFAVLRAGPDGIDAHVISNKMATPFTTNLGA